jgi:hypothetical protein
VLVQCLVERVLGSVEVSGAERLPVQEFDVPVILSMAPLIGSVGRYVNRQTYSTQLECNGA